MFGCLKTLYKCPKLLLVDLFKYIFTKTFFFPDENSKVHSYKKLTNSAIETLINERFTLDQEKKRTNNK